MWLGNKYGYLQDWITQQWVKVTGRRIDITQNQWLEGPIGRADLIDDTFIEDLTRKENLVVRKNEESFGLLESMNDLKFTVDPSQILQRKVIDFYENTLDYSFEFWSNWCGVFYPFGWLINRIFSRRLQQLNLPLNPMDSSKGIESNIVKLMDANNVPKYTIWYRILRAKNDVIYSGVYTHVYMASIHEEVLESHLSTS